MIYQGGERNYTKDSDEDVFHSKMNTTIKMNPKPIKFLYQGDEGDHTKDSEDVSFPPTSIRMSGSS